MSRQRRGPRHSNVADALDEVVDMLNESWKDLTRLLTYKDEFELLAEQLQHYEGSVYVQWWYVDVTLMGCRRLVEHGKDDVLSVRRALYLLRAIADQGDGRRHRRLPRAAGPAPKLSGGGRKRPASYARPARHRRPDRQACCAT